MFDTNKVAKNIKNARTKLNMTQMNLADEMGVSYQAVSNWERGNSMPDISKLPELCKILNISFEELVGEESQEVEITKRLMENEDAAVTLEEMAQVGQLVTPEKIDEKVNETIKKEGKIPFSVLVSMAPFMDRETLGKAAEEVADTDIGKVCAIAPFLSKKALDTIVEKSLKNGNVNIGNITALAPFLSRKAMSSVVECCLANGQADKLTAIAPFMGRDMISQVLQGVDWNQKESDGDVDSNQCDGTETDDIEDMDEDDIAQLAFAAFQQGKDVSQYLDDMEEDDVSKLAFCAIELGRDISLFLDYMDEDDVANLAFRAIELGRDTSILLDYMDEDDVEKLAFMALNAGKDIEAYLDYMDEDAIKRLLLQSVRK